MSETPREKPSKRAFVVQFQAETASGKRRRFRGRVEQVASGEGRRFRSLRELVGFMTESLRLSPRAKNKGG